MTHVIRPLFALFARAVRDDVRAKFPPIMRTLAVLFVLLLIWGSQRSDDYSAPGQMVLTQIAMVNLAAATLFGLGSFSTAVTEEKEDETLGLLLMTRLNPLAILLGKSTARLAGGLLFIIVQIPFTMVCVALGGVDFGQILSVYGILCAYLIFLCNLCLLWSVLCRRSALAVTVSFCIGLFLYVLPIFGAGRTLVRSMRNQVELSWFDQLLAYLVGANPFFHTAQSIYRESRMFLPGMHSISFHLIGSAILFAASWLLFSRFCSATGEIAPRRVVKASGARRRLRVPRPWRHALAWKDFHFLTGGLKGMLLRSAIYLAICGMLIYWIWDDAGGDHQRLVANVFKWCGLLIFGAELGGLASRIFGSERQQLTLSGLIGLPAATSSIIWQKIFGCLPAFLPSLGLYWLGGAILSDWETSHGYSSSRGNSSDVEFALAVLWIAEFILYPILVASLSLRMRRGALLAGFGILLFGNIFAVILINMMRPRGDDTFPYYMMSLLNLVPAFILAARIPRQLAACAAEG